jgi:predicted transcriptional regulator YheO
VRDIEKIDPQIQALVTFQKNQEPTANCSKKQKKVIKSIWDHYVWQKTLKDTFTNQQLAAKNNQSNQKSVFYLYQTGIFST